ncbi:MAG: 3-oxoadipate enol-lactonase [Rhodocyclaceae bacterium]|nr:3-oxoadipate enol-lactonase [Rhodocyclaceae bacterium]MBX3670980.1 3-oxoadipate enol-lactonase [Rhodocyclaceae bacterium]
MSSDDVQYADLPGVRIAYRLDGEAGAPVLVLSNSLGTTLRMWDAQMAAFTRHFRVLRYDTRGHGRSGRPPGAYEMATLGGDVLALLDALDIDRADFCGLSMGGVTGIWLASRAAQRFGKVVLCNTAAKIGNEQTWNARIAAVRAGGVASVTDAVLERWFTAPFRAAQPEAVAAVRDMLVATDAEGYCANSAAIRDMDLRADLPGIALPTLVVGGSADGSVAPAETRALAEAIPNARYVELLAAHMSNIEAADEFNAAVLAFLRGR